ncbi:peptidoglycan DD-metalloendopeptidase family protein [Brevibacillus ginsengisoli]|uniref:peptidoglycan DD-metalloendopeptidase family protein n=1 Tax=Brevibacillus ginsengisoli TaxID=363854 RepID=UPI003CF7ADFB
MVYSEVPVTFSTADEAKQTVIEKTLFQVFNPFASLPSNTTSQGSTIMYSVKPGDTLSEIAHRYGITLRELIEENKITNPHLVGIGMKLMIGQNNITHTVSRGETLDQIAERYQVPKEKLIARNPLLQVIPDNLYVGQVLYIPIPEAKTVLAGSLPLRRQIAQVASRGSYRSREMDWPVEHATITSGFGKRWGKLHKGLDLWNEAKGNTQIVAAKEGTVIEAGANHEGYGYMVIIDHGGGLQTCYAHLRKILVSIGEVVQRGQVLGLMGNTGDSTGYHLHFEVRQDQVPMNPIRYLR